MKMSRCRECKEYFTGSTSLKVGKLTWKHFAATGHRSFKGIRGMGDTTFRFRGDKVIAHA